MRRVVEKIEFDLWGMISLLLTARVEDGDELQRDLLEFDPAGSIFEAVAIVEKEMNIALHRCTSTCA